MASVKLSTKAAGNKVQLKLDGVMCNFIVVHQGKPSSKYDDSCSGTWLLLEDVYENRQWHSSNVNKLESSTIHSYLNSTFLAKFDANIQAQIKQVKLPYRQNGGSGGTDRNGANGLSCKIFLLSGLEVGFTTAQSSYFPNDGAKLSYFTSGDDTTARNKRIAYLNGSATYWWLRSPNTNNTNCVWYIGYNGSYGNDYYASDTYGIRPALVLPSSLLVSDDGSVNTNTAPATPGSITAPDTVESGQLCAVTWEASLDSENNLEGYVLERQTDGGVWEEIYRGSVPAYTDTITGSWALAQYRVCAYDTDGVYSGYAATYVREKNTMTKVSTGEDVFYLPETGSWEVTIAKDGEKASETVACTEYKDYKANVAFVHIYGASWDGTSTTKWTRTDEAAGFVDPVPYVAGASSCGSPFDNRLPWSGMVKEERTGGTMVAIPKFWYKITQNGNGMTVQIADRATEGFAPSPAHMDKGDGKGERDVVYIGRYHCGETAYKSATGQKPKAGITRATARTEIHKLGADIWQADFAVRFTLWLLYIVEYADWNTQITIGKGCGNNSTTENMGYTDSMPYHTGTTQSSRDTYGLGTQYRYIEGLWDNVLDWCDGCYNSSNGLMIILNPNSFSDSSGGISAGTPSNGYPSAFAVSATGGFTMFIPTAASGSDSTYSCDHWYFSASDPCVHVGGVYGQHTYRGLFYLSYHAASYTSSGIGSRLQELP